MVLTDSRRQSKQSALKQRCSSASSIRAGIPQSLSLTRRSHKPQPGYFYYSFFSEFPHSRFSFSIRQCLLQPVQTFPFLRIYRTAIIKATPISKTKTILAQFISHHSYQHSDYMYQSGNQPCNNALNNGHSNCPVSAQFPFHRSNRRHARRI